MRRITISNLYEDLDRSIGELRRNPESVERSRKVVDDALEEGGVYYGINTGFGALARERIDRESLETLQKNLLLSHAVGVGEWVPREISALMLKLKIHALGLGYSGVSMPVFTRLAEFAENDLIPGVPSRGSVGASGDLAPLAHMSLPLIGRGLVWDSAGIEFEDADVVLERMDWQPVELSPKDGLSLINGTQLMTAYGAFVLEKCVRLIRLVDVAAAMTLEALQGSLVPFDNRIQDARPFRGQSEVASNVRQLLVDSEILESHRDCGKVQDPYSLRCVPQVHGATRGALRHIRDVLETEMNAATDNPLVFPDGSILSGGNFHGQPLALALDYAAIALAELASISERRIYLLLAGADGLPQLLMRETGINSGFMIPQYTAAALVSENKVLSHPASVDSLPTSLGQEDHVSMGSISAVKLHSIFRNVETVLGIEVLAAAQALDYRLPLRPGRGVEAAHQFIRSVIPHREADYYFREDLDPCMEIVRGAELLLAVESEVGELL
ncbi:MAG: histidine ammonia-lyase [Rhodothermia bacterium]|nr:histidine ammonia-lyase [Rhodothermia bacterium]